MSSPRWQEIKRIVDAALDRAPSDRARFLDEACSDPEVRKEVDSLLRHEADGFLEKPAASPAFDAPQDTTVSLDLTGRTLSHYEIKERLGRGGMGEVFLAQDQTLDRRVALKLLAEELEEDETAKKRFLREAKSAAALDHPYICKIYEIGEEGGRSFIAMEYIGGETLTNRLVQGGVPLADVLRIASEIAEALETAHREYIVHRDLKPSNIMLTVGGHVKVLDFGLAKRVASLGGMDSQFETASQLTGKGLTLGTLAYMSPEQLRGHPVDARSDVFAFGILLYEMLAGAHPFSKSTSMDTAAAILNLPTPPLTRYRRDVPETLEHIVSKMLAKKPADRYQSVHEVRADLDRVEKQPRRLEERPPALQARASGRTRIWMGLMVLAVLVVVAAFALRRNVPIGRSGARDGPPSVAVLPLTNISDDPVESEYLAQGISQAVTTKLTQVGLRVTPWETAQRYRDSNRSAEAVARELNVDAVLVGTFHVAGNEILTNLSLVDAETGFQSWADIIVEPHDDLFQMQLRIATGVAESLKEALTGEEKRALATPESENVDAYDFYLQGAHTMEEGNQEATNVAFQYFRRAAELDPNLAEAHVGLGSVYSARFNYGWEGGLENLELAEASFERALQLNPADMRARRGLIYVNFFRGRSEACLIHGREAARSGGAYDVESLFAQSQAYELGGMPDRSLPLLRRILEMDPVNQAAHYHLTWAAAWAFEIEQTIEAGNSFLRRFGDDFEIHTAIALAYHASGALDRAREHYNKAAEIVRRMGSSAASTPLELPLVYSGMLFAQLGERDRAEDEWRNGAMRAERSLADYPDNTGVRAYLASFYGLLSDPSAFTRERRRALDADFNAYQLYSLAAAHAARGEIDLAAEVLGHTLEAGRINPVWKLYFSVASAGALQSEALAPFIERYEAEERRLRELY